MGLRLVTQLDLFRPPAHRDSLVLAAAFPYGLPRSKVAICPRPAPALVAGLDYSQLLFDSPITRLVAVLKLSPNVRLLLTPSPEFKVRGLVVLGHLGVCVTLYSGVSGTWC